MASPWDGARPPEVDRYLLKRSLHPPKRLDRHLGRLEARLYDGLVMTEWGWATPEVAKQLAKEDKDGSTTL